MSEVYTFDSINNVNQEFSDKLRNCYYPHKINIYFDKVINCLEDIEFITIHIGSTSIEQYIDSYEFLNNKLSFTVSSINTEYYYNKSNIVKVFSNKNYNVKSIEIELKINNFRIICDSYGEGSGSIKNSCIIKSEFFKTFDDLIEFIMDDSDLSYELSKKYLTKKGGSFSYYKYSDEDEDDDYDNYNSEIVLYEGIAEKDESDSDSNDSDYNNTDNGKEYDNDD